MFIGLGRQFYQATELGKLLRNAFYKHSAPLALGDQRFRLQYRLERRLQRLPPFQVVDCIHL